MSERESKLLPTILVVKDDESFRAILVSALEARDYETRGVADAKRAIAQGRMRVQKWPLSISASETILDSLLCAN